MLEIVNTVKTFDKENYFNKSNIQNKTSPS